MLSLVGLSLSMSSPSPGEVLLRVKWSHSVSQADGVPVPIIKQIGNSAFETYDLVRLFHQG